MSTRRVSQLARSNEQDPAGPDDVFDRLLTVGDVHVADDPGHYRLTEHRSQPLQVMSADRSLVEDGREFGPPARPRRRDRGSP
jgi:hypothetical protein